MNNLRDDLNNLILVTTYRAAKGIILPNNDHMASEIEEFVEKYGKPQVKGLQCIQQGPHSEWFSICNAHDTEICSIRRYAKSYVIYAEDFKFQDKHLPRWSFETLEEAYDYVQQQWEKYVLQLIH